VIDVTDGQSIGFAADANGQDTLFAVRRGERLYVYRNLCPHQGGPLAWRKDRYLNQDGTRIVCFAHGAEFEIESGRCIRGPCLGQSLQAVSTGIGVKS
jgi:nitrite reductase/ring-hydroxylating ferredoxin subunit